MREDDRVDPEEPVLPRLRAAVRSGDLIGASGLVQERPSAEVAHLLDLLPADEAAVVLRLLPKDASLAVFESLDTEARADLITELGHGHVAEVFAHLDPDDRAELLDELPASLARRLLQGLDPQERSATDVVLGYAAGSTGRRMTPHHTLARPGETAGAVLARLRTDPADDAAFYTVPLIDATRTLLGLLSVRDLLLADPDAAVDDLARASSRGVVDEPAEDAARRLLDAGGLALPVVDREQRLVGLLTADDAARVVDAASEEDQARAGGSEPLRRAYLLTSVRHLTRARIVWLLVLAVSAVLTVQVLEIFEATLEQQVVLALFIPLLTGIGGNTGAQAATTVTRSLSLLEVAPRDVLRVAGKEVRTGALLGLLLGALGWAGASLAYGPGIGATIGLTLVAVCTLSATVGGVMPLAARACRVDPAVVSTPFITTFCDASGLIIYLSVARVVLGL